MFLQKKIKKDMDYVKDDAGDRRYYSSACGYYCAGEKYCTNAKGAYYGVVGGILL